MLGGGYSIKKQGMEYVDKKEKKKGQGGAVYPKF